jgi:putative dehydrogenase
MDGTTEKLPRLGFIGLGSLGLPLAKNLIERGYPVVGYRRSDITKFVDMGGQPATSPAEVAKSCDIIFTCLPTLSSLEQVICGKQGIANVRPGEAPLVIELGIFPIEEKERLRDYLKDRGGDLLDCPVSGTPAMASKRQGVIFASGSQVQFDRIQNILKDCLDSVVFCGVFGTSSKIKFVANLLVGIHVYAAVEAVAFAEKLGLDSSFVVDVLKDSGASSFQFKTRGPMMAGRDYPEPMGTPKLLLKDLEVIQEVARQHDFKAEILDTIIPRFEKAIEIGLGDQDVVATIDIFRDPAESPDPT